jgi:hypothetical protein
MTQSNSGSGGSRSVEQTYVGVGTQIINNYLLGEIEIVAGILLLVFSPFTMAYLPFSIVLAASGLLLMIVRTYWSKLRTTARKIGLIVLLLLNLPFAVAFGKERSRLTEVRRTEQRQEQQAKLDERQRKDSLAVCIERITDLQQRGETDKALMALDNADLLVRTPGEKADLGRMRVEVSLVKATELMHKRRYNMAAELLSSVHALDSNNAELLYQRAVCYAKTHHIAAAVHDARRAMFRGHAAADSLYEKINPIRQRVAYRKTLCRDGTFSNATGSGACSHHGGVDQWDYPVYENYRQYE